MKEDKEVGGREYSFTKFIRKEEREMFSNGRRGRQLLKKKGGKKKDITILNFC